MAKTEFEWSSQQQIGMTEVNEKERRLVSLCSLDIEREDETETRWYISFSTIKFFKKKDEKEETWRPVKGYTIPLDNWQDIRDCIEENIEWS
jgi:hypothetical protein